MDVLVKVSGSLTRDEKFYYWLTTIRSPFSGELFIICGGGEQITKVLGENNVPFKFGPQGREIKSLYGRRLAWLVLYEEQGFVEEKLKTMKIEAEILIPVLDGGGRILHINSDVFALALYPNFDKTYLVTKKGRVKSLPPGIDTNRVEIVYL
jgi:hypothetical protein